MTNKPPYQAPKANRPPPPPYSPPDARRGGNQRQGLGEAAIKAFIRSIAGSLGRVIARTLTGGRR
jgi:hypothetical protein